MGNFWDNTHPLATDNTKLYDQLVPSSGKCETMQGELIRAAGKIAYDWYNNGWGCNNWSGAVVFIQKFVPAFAAKRTEKETIEFNTALLTAMRHSHGEPVGISDDLADEVVTTIVAYVTQCVLDHPALELNTRDMYDFSEPAYVEYDDDDEECEEW